MSAIFRNQIIAGHSIGASKLFGALLMLIMLSLVAQNSYHMGNFLDSKLSTAATGLAFTVCLYIVGTGIAALEIPLGKSLVTTYRLHGFTMPVFMQVLLALVIAAMAVFAGVSSQLADADRKNTAAASYSVSASSFEQMRQAALADQELALARANRIYNEESRRIATLNAQAQYRATLVNISQDEARHTLTKPVQMMATGSDEHYVTIMLFSVVCSFGALFASMFHAVYINPLVAMPAFSLKAKANHEWQSDGSNFQSANHELSPLANKARGFLTREKVPAKVVPSTTENANYNKGSSGDAENRPAPVNSMSGAVSNSENGSSVRTLNGAKDSHLENEYSEHHYLTIRGFILRSKIKPTHRPIKQALIDMKVSFVTDAERQAKAGEILARLKDERVILDNPAFGQSGKVLAKYIVNPEFILANDQTEEGELMYKSACPECGKQSSVSESNLKAWNGRVSCLDCNINYPVKDNKISTWIANSKPETN